MSARAVAVALIAVAALVGCGDRSGNDTAVPATEPPSTDPTIEGFVTDIAPFEPVTEDCIEADPDADPDSPVSSDDPPICSEPDTAVLGTVLVEEDPVASAGENKISFTIDRSTALLVERGGSHDPLSFGDLADGMAVVAWADGPIMESYPAQASAAAIVVRPS